MSDLRRTALTAAEVADLLTVKAPRVRQLTSIEHKLWALDDVDRRGRLYPKVQFTDTGMVPYLDQILPQLPADLHPLTVNAVLTLPRVDLTVDGHPASVVEFLTSAAAEHDLPTVLEVVERHYRVPQYRAAARRWEGEGPLPQRAVRAQVSLPRHPVAGPHR